MLNFHGIHFCLAHIRIENWPEFQPIIPFGKQYIWVQYKYIFRRNFKNTIRYAYYIGTYLKGCLKRDLFLSPCLSLVLYLFHKEQDFDFVSEMLGFRWVSKYLSKSFFFYIPIWPYKLVFRDTWQFKKIERIESRYLKPSTFKYLYTAVF